jgi:hypothetical protein
MRGYFPGGAAMSFDRYTQEHHLTPSGWIGGNASYVRDKKPRPADAVETWLEKVDHSSPYAMQDIDWDLVWFSPTVSPEERAALNAKFEHPKVEADEINSRLWKPQKRRRRRPIE